MNVTIELPPPPVELKPNRRSFVKLSIIVLSVMLLLCAVMTPVSAAATERDVVLVLDVSGSMSGTPMSTMIEAACVFIDDIKNASGSNRVAIVTFEDDSRVVSSFTNNWDTLKSTIRGLRTGGMTNMYDGLSDADSLLRSSNANMKEIVLLSDGFPNVGGPNDDGDVSGLYPKLRSKYKIYTIGFFHGYGYYGDARTLLKNIQNNGFYEVTSTNIDDLKFVFGDILNPLFSVLIPSESNPENLISAAGQNVTITVPITFSINIDNEDMVGNKGKIVFIKNGEAETTTFCGKSFETIDITKTGVINLTAISTEDDIGEYQAYFEIYKPDTGGSLGKSKYITFMIKKANPVIIVPGITASKLYDTSGDLVWDGLGFGALWSLITDDIAIEEGLRININNYYVDQNSLSTDNREYGAGDGFKKLVDTLSDDSLFPDERGVYFFSYDWRQSSDSISIALNSYINEILANTGAEQVDLVCHSMGGLVTSSYMSKHKSENKVDTIITIDTPYEGSNSMYNIYGLNLAKYNTIRNFPSVAELSPTDDFINGHKYRSIMSSFLFINIEKIDSTKYTPIATEIFGNLISTRNHVTSYNHELLNYNNAYFVVGSGRSTVTGVVFELNKDGTLKRISDFAEFGDGDQIVPLDSQTMMNSIATGSHYFQKNTEWLSWDGLMWHSSIVD
ncbi:MAG: VWA domain-containing protein, partial [Methanocorpusculum sp.]|nr:VWA domain-containing protein [Methanocorpusculum sp.]